MIVAGSAFDNYFNISHDLSSIEIKENYDQTNCYIEDKLGTKYKGFILIDNPRVKTVCELAFYKSKNQGKYIPRPTFKKIDKDNNLVTRQNNKDLIVGFSDSEDAEKFWRLIGFLGQFKETIDLGEFDDSFRVIHRDAYLLEFDNKTDQEKVSEIVELVRTSNLSDNSLKEIFNNSRKRTIQRFLKLLKNEFVEGGNAIDVYKGFYNLKGDEAVWHHFLKTNDWLLGLNVDVKFIKEFIHEADLGINNTEGKGSPEGDILGLSAYTTLIELKTSGTKIFKMEKRAGDGSRTNTWAFSSDFINGISQCLAQKFDWDKNHKSKDILSDKIIIDQNEVRTLDCKTVFIIGNRHEEFPHNSNIDNILKSETFERFRRNTRNIDILTFDELFERAYHIVFQTKIEKDWYQNPNFRIDL
ncbi:MAG TPA: DUF4263 domain-containing protein [Cyclobacteriaceae bacterium]|nr:DUF4263 domain-containing protein [Cyclobacteriaceae bacterium]HPW62651.1 DUF4263 domain-containing protein [Cyclobacteriaceae bacterium]